MSDSSRNHEGRRTRVAWVVVAGCVAAIAAALLVRYSGLRADVPSAAPRWHVVVHEAALVVFALSLLGYPVMGALILSRRPRNRVGWLMAAIGLLSAGGMLALQVGDARIASAFTEAGTSAMAGALLLIALLVLVFPDGRLPTARWRVPVGIVGLAALVLLLRMADVPVGAVLPDRDLGEAAWTMSMIAVILLVTAAPFGALRRYRRADGLQRAQLSWLALVCQIFLTCWAVGVITAVLLGAAVGAPVLADLAVVGSGVVINVGIPIATAVAITRHRLYEVDRLLSRTVTYGVVTTVAVLLYAGVATAMAHLTTMVGGTSSAPAVATATVAAVTILRPAQHRVQGAVDRRFNRAHVDAQRAVGELRSRLAGASDLDQVATDVLGTVHATVQPASAAMWLRPPLRRAVGTHPGGPLR